MTKQEIVLRQLGFASGVSSHGDAEYVAEFERLYGELTEDNFREHFDTVDFTEWGISMGY